MASLIKIIILFSTLFFTQAKQTGKETAKTKSKSRVARALASSKDPKEKIVVDYFKCFEVYKEDLKLKNCIDRTLHSKLSEVQKDRLYSWLVVFDARLARFTPCGKMKMQEAAFFPEATAYFVCGDIDIGRTTKEVIFFFKPESTGLEKLSSVYY
ncbi:MAG: hypothetical protein IT287_03405 [Bdellovibrionaceae bacterium]|nr:hypothetical protein [Pseudobdellovibrionaceae bacterium]